MDASQVESSTSQSATFSSITVQEESCGIYTVLNLLLSECENLSICLYSCSGAVVPLIFYHSTKSSHLAAQGVYSVSHALENKPQTPNVNCVA